MMINGKKVYFAEFSTLALARSWAARGEKSSWVVRGDNNKYWVVRPVDAGRLEKVGYAIV